MPGNTLSVEEGVEKLQRELGALELEKEAAFEQVRQLEEDTSALRHRLKEATAKMSAFDNIRACARGRQPYMHVKPEDRLRIILDIVATVPDSVSLGF